MRIEISKGDQRQWIKEDRLNRFLEQGWQLVAEPDPKKVSNKAIIEVKVEAHADIINEEKYDEDYNPDLEAPLFKLPTNNQ